MESKASPSVEQLYRMDESIEHHNAGVRMSGNTARFIADLLVDASEAIDLHASGLNGDEAATLRDRAAAASTLARSLARKA